MGSKENFSNYNSNTNSNLKMNVVMNSVGTMTGMDVDEDHNDKNSYTIISSIPPLASNISKMKKKKDFTSEERLYNKKLKVCKEIKNTINPKFQEDMLLSKKTRTLKGFISKFYHIFI